MVDLKEGFRPNPVNKQSDGNIQFTQKQKGYQKNSYTDPDETETVESWTCHPDCPIAILDGQSGERKAGASVSPDVPSRTGKNVYGKYGRHSWQSHGDTGFASRFFYTAKASRTERQDSTHPTIKPLALIEYLVKLTVPPADAHILDCFIGSGTLAIACENLDIKYTGIDLDCGDAINRISNMPSRQLGLF